MTEEQQELLLEIKEIVLEIRDSIKKVNKEKLKERKQAVVTVTSVPIPSSSKVLSCCNIKLPGNNNPILKITEVNSEARAEILALKTIADIAQYSALPPQGVKIKTDCLGLYDLITKPHLTQYIKEGMQELAEEALQRLQAYCKGNLEVKQVEQDEDEDLYLLACEGQARLPVEE